MSVIAVKNIPGHWKLKRTTHAMERLIKGHFQPINFAPTRNKNGTKTCYLRLSELLDPLEIVERINLISEGPAKQFTAFIPKEMPDLPMARKKNLPKAFTRFTCDTDRKVHVLQESFRLLLTEIFHKYPNVYKVYNIEPHTFLNKLSQKLCERLVSMVLVNSNICDTPFYLTKLYRTIYPHNTDFGFIKQCLIESSVERGQGVPVVRSEKELSMLSAKDYKDLDIQRLRDDCQLFTDPIVNELKEHIDGLDSEPTPTDTKGEAIRKRVRAELQNVNNYLELIVKQITDRCTSSQIKNKSSNVDIYGEPYLPPVKVIMPIFDGIKIRRVIRSPGMFNLVRLKVKQDLLHEVLQFHGTVIGSATLQVRPVMKMHFMTPQSILQQLENTVKQAEKSEGRSGGEILHSN